MNVNNVVYYFLLVFDRFDFEKIINLHFIESKLVRLITNKCQARF